MNHKCLVAAAYLFIIVASATLPAYAGQVTGINPQQTTRLADAGNTIGGSTRKTDGSQANLKLLDTAWIFGFTIAGLLLLRKVQRE